MMGNLGCIDDAQRLSSASAGEEQTSETDVGWSDLLDGKLDMPDMREIRDLADPP